MPPLFKYQTATCTQPAQLRNLRHELVTGARTSGSNPWSQAWNAVQAAMGPGKLSLQAFVDYKLWESHHTPETRAAYLDPALHWPLTNACNDPTWAGVVGDKWLTESLLNQHNIPTSETLAVLWPGVRDYGTTPKLATPRALQALVAAVGPVFVKPVGGIASFGAAAIYHHSQAPTAWSKMRHRGPMLVQRMLENHPDLGCRALATVRLMNMMGDNNVEVTGAVWKIPAPGSIADNLWRPGNSVAHVDTGTGKLIRAVRGVGLAQEVFTPSVQVLPHWDAVRALNERCARMFAPLTYTSTDIALTHDGPVVVEVNNGGSYHLHQVASGAGFLTARRRAWFEGRGVRF